MRNKRNSIALAIFLLAIGLAALFGQSSLMVVLALVGLLLLVRSIDGRQSQHPLDYDNTDYDDERLSRGRQRRGTQGEPVYRHALDAVARAGHNPDNLRLLPVDIGVLGFEQGKPQPDVYRTWSLPDDLDYVQPFAQIRLPRAASGRVRFELVDSAGHAVFVHEDIFDLAPGRNFITPSARLPIHNQHEIDGPWRLKISADGILLADHRFYFENAATSDVRRHIGEDGELTAEMRAVLAETQLRDLSLDELLAVQEDDKASQMRQR